jgi:hypothetical protein
MRGTLPVRCTVADDEVLRERVKELRRSTNKHRGSPVGVRRDRRLGGLQFHRRLIARCTVAADGKPLIRPSGAPSPRWRGEKGVRG